MTWRGPSAGTPEAGGAAIEAAPVAWWGWCIAAAVALACILIGFTGIKPQTLRAYDQPLYLSIASDLVQTGVYTNGRFGNAGVPGAYTAPLYPAMLAGLALADPLLAQDAACVRGAAADQIGACPTSLGVLLPVQVALACLTLMLVWRGVLAIGGGKVAAWAALLAAGLGTTEYAVYARTAMTEALSLPLSALAGVLLVLLVQAPRWRTALGLGVVLGLLSLTRPEYLYLAVAIGVVGLGAVVWRRWRLGLMMVAALVVCGAVMSPWAVRNERLFGTTAPTYGYAGFILVQRMAYQAMTGREWLASFVYSLPGFGPKLARDVMPDAVARLGWEERPDTFYMVGNGPMLAELKAAAPDPAAQVGYLLRRYVVADPVWFVTVTVAMAWKLLWVRKYFSLVAVPCFFWLVWRGVRRRDAGVLALVLPGLFILGVHAATSVGTPRYSLMMIPAYAAGFGLLVELGWSRWRRAR